MKCSLQIFFMVSYGSFEYSENILIVSPRFIFPLMQSLTAVSINILLAISILLQQRFKYFYPFLQISFKFRGTFGCLLAPTYAFRISYWNVRRHSSSLFVAYLSVAYTTTELHPRNATLSTNVLFCPVRHIKAESVVPVRIRHVVPEIRVGESGIRPVPEIAAPVCGKSYFKITSVYYLEGQPPLLLAQNSPLKGSELNAESAVPARIRHADPEIREGESGTRPAPESAAP